MCFFEINELPSSIMKLLSKLSVFKTVENRIQQYHAPLNSHQQVHIQPTNSTEIYLPDTNSGSNQCSDSKCMQVSRIQDTNLF